MYYKVGELKLYIFVDMQISEADMIAAKIPKRMRDYCAHHLIDFYKCKRQKWPYVAGCKHELHVHEACEFEE